MTRSRLDALICEQEHLETLTRKEIETVQLFKLNRLLLREKKRAGFYRNLPEHLNRLSELALTERYLTHSLRCHLRHYGATEARFLYGW